MFYCVVDGDRIELCCTWLLGYLAVCWAWILVVAVALVVTVRRGQHYQLVTIDEQTVEVIESNGNKRDVEQFQRHWVQVRIKPGQTRFQPVSLWIGSHGHYTELRSVLTEDDKKQLATRLTLALKY